MIGIAERRGLRAQTRQLLSALGDDADAVAASLAAEGVRGHAGSGRGCAIAVYLAAVVGADQRVRSVTVSSSRLGVKPASAWRPVVVVRLPRPVRQFISAFDAERFPELLVARSCPGRSPIGDRHLPETQRGSSSSL
jgi:hypothetical protein